MQHPTYDPTLALAGNIDPSLPGHGDTERCTAEAPCGDSGCDRCVPAEPLRLPVPRVPERCGDCGYVGAEWPLGVFGGRLNVTCPACFCIVAPVVAVAVKDN